MTTLTDWLLECIAADEEVARAATSGPWRWEPPSEDKWPESDQSLVSESGELVLVGWGYDASGIDGEDADRAHIATHDPARVLRQCEALRKVVELYRDWDGEAARSPDYWAAPVEEILLAVAEIYADRPGFGEWDS